MTCSQRAFYPHGVSRSLSMGCCGKFSSCSCDGVVCMSSVRCDCVFCVAPKPARFKLRNSLFVTVCIFSSLSCHACFVRLQQPMRTPAQASINIIEKEDVAGTRMQAKYHAMENQDSVALR